MSLNPSINQYEYIRSLIIKNLNVSRDGKRPNLDNINKIIGTARGIFEMSANVDDYAKLGDLILNNKLTSDMKRNRANHLDTLREISKQFSFPSFEAFLEWFELAYQSPMDLGQFGKMRVCTPEERVQFKGDVFSLHVANTEFLTNAEYVQVKQGAPRRVGSIWGQGERELLSLEESIKLWEKNLLLAVAIANKYNKWSELNKAFESQPCGQSRFASLNNYIENMKKDLGLDNNALQELVDEIKHKSLNEPPESIVPAVSSTTPSEKAVPLVQRLFTTTKRPTSTAIPRVQGVKVDPLEKYTDSTRLGTGRVPNAKGLCLIAEHMRQKHGVEIFITENTQDVSKVLELMTKVNPGVKVAVQAKTGEHWYALMIEKDEEGKINVVLMDSLGDGALTNQPPTEIIDVFHEFRKKYPECANAKLYQNIDLVQFDADNCGTFSMKFCEHMLRDSDFVEHIKKSKYIVDASTRKELDQAISRKPIPQQQSEEIDYLYSQNIESYVLPPKYYAYNQRSKYIEYYSRGKDVHESVVKKAKEKMKSKVDKNNKYVFTEKVNGEVVTKVMKQSSVGTSNGREYEVNMRVIHFRNKYWDKAIANFDKKGEKEVTKIINGRSVTNLTVERLNQCVPKSKLQVPERPLTPLEVRNSHVTLTDQQAEREFRQREEVSGALERSEKMHKEQMQMALQRKKNAPLQSELGTQVVTTPVKSKPVISELGVSIKDRIAQTVREAKQSPQVPIRLVSTKPSLTKVPSKQPPDTGNTTLSLKKAEIKVSRTEIPIVPKQEQTHVSDTIIEPQPQIPGPSTTTSRSRPVISKTRTQLVELSTEHEKKWQELQSRIRQIKLDNPGVITANAHKLLLAYLNNPPKGPRGANLSSSELLNGLQATAKKINESNLKSEVLKELVKDIKQLDLAPGKTTKPQVKPM